MRDGVLAEAAALRAARTDLVAAYDSLGKPDQAARFRFELADSAAGRR